ncbi:hypothetical protein QWM81_06275 [Streptomyces ficellus]|uniref:DUF1499 domain-containing protein n=1 Tax=Streptomyces ficellus TaxID=1977088 RepID=A0ABT7Z2D1_9ACTN|nr:hypothetical protein [Streptomyces ficellus]MDN3293654.1 hypothetical protein [Streptomyces ficellus]
MGERGTALKVWLRLLRAPLALAAVVGVPLGAAVAAGLAYDPEVSAGDALGAFGFVVACACVLIPLPLATARLVSARLAARRTGRPMEPGMTDGRQSFEATGTNPYGLTAGDLADRFTAGLKERAKLSTGPYVYSCLGRADVVVLVEAALTMREQDFTVRITATPRSPWRRRINGVETWEVLQNVRSRVEDAVARQAGHRPV